MDGGYFDVESCALDVFRDLTERTLEPGALAFAASIEGNVAVYDAAGLETVLADAARRQALLAEWARVLGQLSGVLVLKGAYADTGVLDEATAAYERIIAREAAAGAGKGD